MRIANLALVACLIAATPAAAQSDDLYKRVETRLAGDPALAAALGQPAPQMADIDWLVGTWDITVEVQATPDRPAEHGTSTVTKLYGGVWLEFRDVYPAGNQDVAYVGYDPATRRWVNISIDAYANANISYSEGWKDGRLVFEADMTVIGERAHLRQTLIKDGPDAYRLVNEERIDGGWRVLDTYRYARRR